MTQIAAVNLVLRDSDQNLPIPTRGFLYTFVLFVWTCKDSWNVAQTTHVHLGRYDTLWQQQQHLKCTLVCLPLYSMMYCGTEQNLSSEI